MLWRATTQRKPSTGSATSFNGRWCTRGHTTTTSLVGKVVNSAEASIAPPSSEQLRTLFVHSAVPFVAFGFVDNTVLIQAGDLIDNTFGVYFALPTLAAAAMGQVFSDTTGVLCGNTIEALATRLGLPLPQLTSSQRMMRISKLTSTAGSVVGVITGCCLGMLNLLFIDLGASERRRREEELKTVFEMIMGQGHEIAECERSTLFLVDKEKQELWSVHATSGVELPMLRLPLSKGIAGYVARTGDLVRIDDVYEDERFYSEIDKDTKFKTKCLLCAPVLSTEGEILGVVQFLNKKGGSFCESDEKLILMLCQHVGIFMAKIGQQ
eukprot:CAMPEP_0196580004 /NCGR_PEP_ID=MMETSP1081-20130531/26247_1 /TAXON_ID=36882 /ORGANISM="Pyramimonas amylifera, Strain CCMP720" /LENGTH=323 /DNA_ID=CAMNT_0041899753 /DNA_START=270 /DNA_END=1241 /DNA_ORIENTATION=-